MIYQKLSKFIDSKTLAFDLIHTHTHTLSLSLSLSLHTCIWNLLCSVSGRYQIPRYNQYRDMAEWSYNKKCVDWIYASVLSGCTHEYTAAYKDMKAPDRNQSIPKICLLRMFYSQSK